MIESPFEMKDAALTSEVEGGPFSEMEKVNLLSKIKDTALPSRSVSFVVAVAVLQIYELHVGSFLLVLKR